MRHKIISSYRFFINESEIPVTAVPIPDTYANILVAYSLVLKQLAFVHLWLDYGDKRIHFAKRSQTDRFNLIMEIWV